MADVAYLSYTMGLHTGLHTIYTRYTGKCWKAWDLCTIQSVTMHFATLPALFTFSSWMLKYLLSSYNLYLWAPLWNLSAQEKSLEARLYTWTRFLKRKTLVLKWLLQVNQQEPKNRKKQNQKSNTHTTNKGSKRKTMYMGPEAGNLSAWTTPISINSRAKFDREDELREANKVVMPCIEPYTRLADQKRGKGSRVKSEEFSMQRGGIVEGRLLSLVGVLASYTLESWKMTNDHTVCGMEAARCCWRSLTSLELMITSGHFLTRDFYWSLIMMRLSCWCSQRRATTGSRVCN